MHKGSLPGVSGLRKHNEVSQGVVADMPWYMGPIGGVSNILDKLLVIFGTVALFDVLMQKLLREIMKRCPCLTQGLRAP